MPAAFAAEETRSRSQSGIPGPDESGVGVFSHSPGQTLGKKLLLKVEDIMQSGDAVAEPAPQLPAKKRRSNKIIPVPDPEEEVELELLQRKEAAAGGGAS